MSKGTKMAKSCSAIEKKFFSYYTKANESLSLSLRKLIECACMRQAGTGH